MNKILLLISILSLVSCQEEVQMYDKLDDNERTDIDNQSNATCITNFTPIYDTFKEKSAEIFDSSTYDRAKGFYHEYKSGNDVKRKLDIRVWKRDSTTREIYFYITETQLATESYFFRITQTQADEIISDLLTDHCTKFYTSTTSSNGPLTVKYEYNKSNAPNTDYYVDTYSLPFTYNPFFANFQLSRTVTTKNSEGTVQGTAVSYTSTLTAKTYTFDSDVATSSAYYTQKFCNLKRDATSSKYRFSTSSSIIGFQTECVETTPPAGWNLTL